MKTCKSCRWIEYQEESGPYCGSPRRPPDHEWTWETYVHGRQQRLQWILCSACRNNGSLCGMDAKWHEPRPPGLWQRLRAAFMTGAAP